MRSGDPSQADSAEGWLSAPGQDPGFVESQIVPHDPNAAAPEPAAPELAAPRTPRAMLAFGHNCPPSDNASSLAIVPFVPQIALYQPPNETEPRAKRARRAGKAWEEVGTEKVEKMISAVKPANG